MRRNAARSLFAGALAGAAVLLCALQGSGAAPQEDREAAGAPPSAALDRLTRHFDFEEAEEAPHEMPLHWYRRAAAEGATSQGFPPFGKMRLTDEVAYSGRWSFEFELDGGSLAARVPTAVIPIMPTADYVVLARVRTQGLEHARAAIAAWFYDKQGNSIEASYAQSRLVKTGGQWDTLVVHLRGQFDEAADLAIELQLLQPRQFQQRRSDEPALEDVSGKVWFDDVTAWHVPHVDLDLTSHPARGGDGASAAFTMMVLDLAHNELDARLRVYDLEGKVVFESRFPSPRTPIPGFIDVPLNRYGWYRAVLDILHEGEMTTRRTLNFAHAPVNPWRVPREGDAPTISFALAMPESWHEFAEEVPRMAREAAAETVILPVLTRLMNLATAKGMHARAKPAIEALRRNETEIIFALSSMPADLARHLGVAGDDVLVALAGDDSVWREYLDELLINFAFEVERWQIGPTTASYADALWQRDVGSIVRRARRGLASFVPEPLVVLPLAVEHANMRGAGEDSRTISIAHAIRPEAIDDLSAISDHRAGDVVFLEAPPANLYRPRERVADLAFRVLHAWRAGAKTVAIAPPWSPDEDGRLMAEPTLGAWRTLAAHLAGRRFAGELSLGPGMHAWIVESTGPRDAALITWSDHRFSADVSEIHEQSFTMQLADSTVHAVDLFGNVRDVPMQGGEHVVPVTHMPMFIEGISAPLVKFRGGFSFDPRLIPSELRAHEHALVLQNPWDMPISGTIQLADDPRWRITPRTQKFIIRPREEVRLPVQVVLDRGILMGRKTLRAQIELSADANYQLELETEFDVGIADIDLSATWHVVRNVETGDDDLVVTQYILNTGDPETTGRLINADAFVLAPNVRQDRRLITGLAPGELAVRSFHIPGGAKSLAGKTLRVGLSSRDNAGKLNLLLEIPPLGQMPQAAVTP